MSDNVAITAGSGTSIAADDVSSVYYQKIKLDAGGDGVSVPIVAGQQLAAASVPVILASDQTALPVTDNSTTLSVDDGGGALTVDGTVAVSGSVAVTGTFYQATQPVSAASLPLPSGAATAALQGGGLPAALAAGGGLKIEGVAGGVAVPVSGTVAVTNADITTVAGAVSDGHIQADIVGALPAGTNAIGKLASNTGVDIGDVDVTSISAGETHVGEVTGNATILDATLSLDTNVYASGDVLADTQEVASAYRVAAGKALLTSVTLNDKDDQGGALDLVFLRSNVTIGTENSAVSISDANADEILGIIQVAAGDWLDLGGCRVATLPASRCGILLTAAAAATSLWIAAISRDTKTYTASGITLHIGLERY
jgi:hypothetical protein